MSTASDLFEEETEDRWVEQEFLDEQMQLEWIRQCEIAFEYIYGKYEPIVFSENETIYNDGSFKAGFEYNI
jgi:hypothetical protein